MPACWGSQRGKPIGNTCNIDDKPRVFKSNEAPGKEQASNLMRWIILAAAFMLIPSVAAGATTKTLYDGTLGSTPDVQGWIYASFPLMRARATQFVVGASTVLDTTFAMSDMAGYVYRLLPPAPPLDRSIGFRLLFSLRIAKEKHASSHRAGFSLIVLSNDLKGVELGFWKNEIWAQGDRPLFTKSETSGPFDAGSKPVSYTLTIRGDAYTLAADGDPILSGMVKDYSSLNAPPFDFVYRQPNFLFFGDNTSSAAAQVVIHSIKIEASSAGVTPSAAKGAAPPQRRGAKKPLSRARAAVSSMPPITSGRW
jgi:hypothetical protein